MSTVVSPRRNFVVTGCGRSGTKYTAEVFSRLGLRCGHEVIFDPPVRSFKGFGSAHGDVSLAAAPFVAQLPPGTVVLHQVRHPLRVIASFASLEFFVDPPRWSLRNDVAHRWKSAVLDLLHKLGLSRQRGTGSVIDYLRMTMDNCPSVFEESSMVDRCARYWLEWNALVDRASARAATPYMQYQIEQLDPAKLTSILEMVGVPVRANQVADALARVPSDTNKKTASTELRWEDVRPGLRALLLERAAAYGYDTPRRDSAI